jgi:hypothetical protein
VLTEGLFLRLLGSDALSRRRYDKRRTRLAGAKNLSGNFRAFRRLRLVDLILETRSVFPSGFSDSALTPIPVLGSEIGAAKCKTAKDHGHHQVIFVHYDPPFFGES